MWMKADCADDGKREKPCCPSWNTAQSDGTALVPAAQGAIRQLCAGRESSDVVADLLQGQGRVQVGTVDAGGPGRPLRRVRHGGADPGTGTRAVPQS